MLISFVWNLPTSLQSLGHYLLPAATLSQPSPPPAPGRASFPSTLSPLQQQFNGFFSLQPEGPFFFFKCKHLCLKLVKVFPLLYSKKKKTTPPEHSSQDSVLVGSVCLASAIFPFALWPPRILTFSLFRELALSVPVYSRNFSSKPLLPCLLCPTSS